MTLPLLFPDVVALVRDYLDDNLTATVRAREPNPFVTPLITVRRVGGGDSLVMDRARIDLLIWADDLAEASDLAQTARAYMLAMPGVRDSVTVYDVTTFSGPSLIWDEDRDLPRYLMTFEVAVRGTAL